MQTNISTASFYFEKKNRLNLDLFFFLCYNISTKKHLKGGGFMGMTDKQFNSYIRLILDIILKALKTMPEGDEKDELQRLADNLQKTIED